MYSTVTHVHALETSSKASIVVDSRYLATYPVTFYYQSQQEIKRRGRDRMGPRCIPTLNHHQFERR